MSETRPPFHRRILNALLSTPLRFKITVPYLIVVIILAGLVTFFASKSFARTLREQFSSRIADASSQVSDSLFEIETCQLSSLRAISRTDGVASAVAGGDVAQLSDLVRPIALNSQLELVNILDLEGQALFTFHQDRESSTPSYVTSEATNYEDLLLVQSVLAGEVDELGDKFAAIVFVPWGAAVYTAGPITQNNELVGVVLVGEYLDSIATELFEQSRTGVSIYDPQGVLISSSLVGQAGTLATISTSTLNAVAEYRGERLITRTIQAGSRIYVEALTSLFIRGEPTVYVQGVALPEALLTEQSGPSPFQLTSWFLIATLSVIGLGFVIAQAIAVPVFDLLTASTRVAEGDLDVKLGVETSDELGMLSRTFNTMVDELRQREFMRELFGAWYRRRFARQC